MACKKCKPHLQVGVRSGDFSELEVAFDLTIESSVSLACSGIGVCKTCKTEIRFSFEEFIHTKLWVDITKNVDLDTND
ncbi:MAG: hypothetical protein GY810_04960 [Aureispira sp.]|nr:hypothetical protein [Aureispira sp.]